jgi:hypothetical protein
MRTEKEIDDRLIWEVAHSNNTHIDKEKIRVLHWVLERQGDKE